MDTYYNCIIRVCSLIPFTLAVIAFPTILYRQTIFLFLAPQDFLRFGAYPLAMRIGAGLFFAKFSLIME